MRSFALATAALVTVVLVMPDAAASQAVAVSAPARTAPPTAPTVTSVASATRATRAPVIDGRDDDDIWRQATPITEFREFEPKENADPRFRTEARVAYDARNLYVFARMFDPHPDSIKHALTRRDVRGPSDQIKVIIDAYHDKRTGIELAVNPDGVKRDYTIYDDNNEDESWDGVWDVATTVDSLGWTAEYRVPLSQVRYGDAPTHTFGFGIWRDIERFKERVSWPIYSQSRNGLMSQLGDLQGVDGIDSPRRIELMPYTVAKNLSQQTASGFGRSNNVAVGADVKYGLTSNLTIDATINPDFGQVESDPSVFNLREVETLFQEKRPFFLEGTGIFRDDVNCNIVNCSGEGLFYSRRVGRSPTDPGGYADNSSPIATTILGAGKLTGRLAGGLSLGLLEAVTQREQGSFDRTIEPQSNYMVLRASQDLRAGQSGVGLIATAVNRQLDGWTENGLRRSAYVAGFDFRHQFFNRNYTFSGSATRSQVSGSAPSITALQLSPVHDYQRPDGNLRVDTSATSLSGDAEQVKFSKLGGGIIRFETSWQRTSPGFEINDLGFLGRADEQGQSNWFALNFAKQGKYWRRAQFNFNQWQLMNAHGMLTDFAANTNWHINTKNNWWFHTQATQLQLPGSFCDHCTRGGPAIRRSPLLILGGGFDGNDGRRIIPSFWTNWGRGDYGRSDFASVSPWVQVRVSSRFDVSVGANASRNRDDSQWYGNLPGPDSLLHYTFAHLRQATLAFTNRLNYTATPNLSLQVYAAPFVTKGQFTNVRELDQPRAKDYDLRYKTYFDTKVTSSPRGFNFKAFNSNVVLRWEYRPGSALFAVWSQGRSGFDPQYGTQQLGGDFRNLFGLHPDNTFLVKMSYWFSR